MGWGIIIFKSLGHFYPFVMADDRLYDGMRENCQKYELKFIGGKKGITDEHVDTMSEKE